VNRVSARLLRLQHREDLFNGDPHVHDLVLYDRPVHTFHPFVLELVSQGVEEWYVGLGPCDLCSTSNASPPVAVAFDLAITDRGPKNSRSPPPLWMA
jgi:hypothetical protein